MDILLITLGIVAVLGIAIFFLMKAGKIEDKDNNNIPDVVEDAAKETKRRVKRVAQEAKDVKKAVKDVAKQTGDVVKAANGDKRKGRKPAAKKSTTKTKK